MLIRHPRKTLGVPIDDSATSYHRVMQPLYFLRKDHNYPIEFLGEREDQLEQYKWASALYIQCLYTPGAYQFYAEYKKKGKKIFLDFDDDYINIPEDSPEQTVVIDHETGETHQFPPELRSIFVKQFCQLADVITVTTPALKNLYSMVNKNVVVIPNCVSDDMFRDKPRTDNSKVRILWSGSSSHKPDLELIKEPLTKLKEKFGDEIELHMQGPLDFNEIFPDLEFIAYPSVPFGDYLNLIQDINPDIALGPLKENPFNASKSNLKFLQMSLMGACFVGSNFGPYAETIDDGVDGVLCSNSQQWIDKISNLIQDKELRNTIAAKGLATTKDNYMIEQHLDKWKDLLLY